MQNVFSKKKRHRQRVYSSKMSLQLDHDFYFPDQKTRRNLEEGSLEKCVTWNGNLERELGKGTVIVCLLGGRGGNVEIQMTLSRLPVLIRLGKALA